MNNLPANYNFQNQENEFEADSLLAEEEKARKRLAKKRTFWVLVVIGIILLALFILEISTIF